MKIIAAKPLVCPVTKRSSKQRSSKQRSSKQRSAKQGTSKQLGANWLSAKSVKPLLLATLCSTALMGCQTTPSTTAGVVPANLSTLPATVLTSPAYQQQVAANTKAYQQQFANSEGLTPDTQARTTLVSALQQHLTSNHVAVTHARIHDRPYIKQGSVDTLADSLFMVLMDMAFDYLQKDSLQKDSIDNDNTDDAYYDDDSYYDDDYSDDGNNNEVFYADAYRTEADYLATPDAAYTNFIDDHKAASDTSAASPSPLATAATVEKEATASINRATGMSSDYNHSTQTILSYVDNIDTCLNEFSYDLDQIVDADPSVSANSAAVTSLLQTYQNCKTQVSADYQDEIAQPIGYQQQYLNRANRCVSQYEKQITDLLNPRRQPSAIDYEQYDAIFESYDNCDDSVYALNALEPRNYIKARWPEYMLQHQQNLVDCADTMLNQQTEAAAQGVTYANAPDAYKRIYTENLACIAAAEADKDVAAQSDSDNDSAAADYDNDDYNGYGDDDYSYGDEYETPEDSPEDRIGDPQLEDYQQVLDILAMLKYSPQQIEANNFYQNQYQSFTRISEFNATAKQVNDIYSYDFASPSALYSMQLPIALDFNQAKMTLDPSAILPFVALVDPKNAPTLDELRTRTVDFTLPETLTAQLPPTLVYDAFIEAIGYSFSELESGYFTMMDIEHDDFAKEMGASAAIKVHLDAHQTGKLLGVMVKRMANNLQAYVAAHPEDFSDVDKVNSLLAKWQEVNTKYQTNDVGALLQLVEAIAPVTLNQVNVYYLDDKGQLLAKQTRSSIGSDIIGATSTMLSQTRFDAASFRNHPLHGLFVASYGQPFNPDTPKSLDGNAWLHQQQQADALADKAQRARERYYDNDNDSDDYANGNDYADKAAAIDDSGNESSDDYQPMIRIVDYGNVNDADYNVTDAAIDYDSQGKASDKDRDTKPDNDSDNNGNNNDRRKPSTILEKP